MCWHKKTRIPIHVTTGKHFNDQLCVDIMQVYLFIVVILIALHGVNMTGGNKSTK